MRRYYYYNEDDELIGSGDDWAQEPLDFEYYELFFKGIFGRRAYLC